MPNNYFRFKEFTVFQDKAAMKVCTDSCLFGAWLASFIDPGVNRILDIGTGTGLLSLMLAQVSGASVDAVEIDECAYQQSVHNFNISPWKNRLNAFHTSIQEFHSAFKYDLIVSNPPFYRNNLTSPDAKRNIAIHGSMLTLYHLIDGVRVHLNDEGFFAVLLPPSRMGEFEILISAAGLFIVKKCAVKQTASHVVFRYMCLVSKVESAEAIDEDVIIIRDNGHEYTDRFYQLLKDYYLFGK